MTCISRIFLGFTAVLGLVAGSALGADAMLRVLILSGANNHDCKTTTPAIKAALEESGRFVVDIEDHVMDMKPEAFAPYAVILSNFNTFGTDAPGAKVLASVTPDPASHGSGKPENILFTTETGGGRGFAIFLGHDVVSMKNPAWRSLLQRGTEWASTGMTTIASSSIPVR